MTIIAQLLFGPANKSISDVKGKSCRGKSQAGNRALFAENNIFQVLTNRLGIAQVMIMLDETIEQFFVGGSPHLFKMKQWADFFQPGIDWCCVYCNRFRPFSAILTGFAFWRGLCDMSLPLKMEQQSPAYHIFWLSVMLCPVPGLAYSSGERTAGIIRVCGNGILDKGNIGGSDCPPSV